jgi:hypothetical protein
MTRLLSLLGILAVLGLLAAPSTALAQRGGMATRMYDLTTVETIQGPVTALDTVTSRGGGPGRTGRHQGLHLQVDTGDETLPVHLGPLFYLQDQALTLQVGDTVTVRGSRVTMRNAPALIAARIQSGDRTWTLRDHRGRPAWRGQRRRN